MNISLLFSKNFRSLLFGIFFLIVLIIVWHLNIIISKFKRELKRIECIVKFKGFSGSGAGCGKEGWDQLQFANEVENYFLTCEGG